MKSFPRKDHRNRATREYKESLRAAEGRTATEVNRYTRACKRFAENIELVMRETEFRPMPWHPYEHVVTDRDDDHIDVWRNLVEREEDGYDRADDGRLLKFNRDTQNKIYSTNCIEAVMVFTAHRDIGEDSYMLKKRLYSPFKCDNWGRAPLNLSQWSIIAIPYILSRALWQYEKAVNWYVERNDLMAGYSYDYIVGWYLDRATRPSQQKYPEGYVKPIWTGPTIYSLATNSSFKPSTTATNLT